MKQSSIGSVVGPCSVPHYHTSRRKWCYAWKKGSPETEIIRILYYDIYIYVYIDLENKNSSLHIM